MEQPQVDSLGLQSFVRYKETSMGINGDHCFVRDHGAGGLAEGKLIGKNGCVTLRCEACDHIQYESRVAIKRAKQPRCDRCGGYLDFSEAEKKRRSKVRSECRADALVEFGGGMLYGHRKERRCTRCGCKLRKTNPDTVCSPCDQSMILEEIRQD